MADLKDLASLDATAQAALVQTREVSPLELVTAAVERAEAVNGDLNAIIHPRYEQAIEEAKGALADGPFSGVPFVLKDLDGIAAGEPLHAGTRFLKDHKYVAPTDSWLTARFRRAGLVCIGRTNTPELGLLPSTEPLTCGPTHNPWDLTRTPFGSSGGSAAAVAAGIVPLGHAGDGGGSIRLPASACGLVGLKPSRGRITLGPEAGEIWGGLVARLVVSRTVRDTAAILSATSGPGTGDPYWAALPGSPFLDEIGMDPGRLRIGWRTSSPDPSVTTQPDCVDAVTVTAALLETLGHDVSEASPAALDDPVTSAHFAACFGAWTAREIDHLGELVGVPATADGFEPGTWAVVELGRAMTAAQYLAGVEGLHAFTRAAVAWWVDDGWDLLLTPTAPEPPPVLGEFHIEGEPLGGLIRSAAIVPFTLPFNITGQPAISLPVHETGDGLPIGVQLVAAPGREDVLIRVAAQLEAAVSWADRRPPTHA